MSGVVFKAPDTPEWLMRSGEIGLRRLADEDLLPFLAYRREPEVARYQSWAVMDTMEAAAFLRRMARVDPLFQTSTWTQIAVADMATATLMGDVGLYLSHDATEAELGITLASVHWGKGIATCAMRLAFALAFADPGIRRIVCGADQRNQRSLDLIRRLGFTHSHTETVGPPGEIDEVFHLERSAFDLG